MSVPPHDLEAEQAALGCVLLAGVPALHQLVDEGLEADHFYSERHQAIYRAALELDDRAGGIDAVTVLARLAETPGGVTVDSSYVHSLAAWAVLTHARQYARTIRELADLRRIRLGAQRILEAVELRDLDKVADGEALLSRRERGERRTSTPEQLADEIFATLEGGEPETFGWPWRRLDKLTMGGMRRGQLTLIAGWSSHGKSVFLDQTLESAVKEGCNVHLFINEMTKAERTSRTIARLASVSFEQVMLNRLSDDERGRVVRALERIPFGITDVSGWSAHDVAREVRRRRYDVVGIDIFNRFPFPGNNKREAMEEASRALNELTKVASCHVLLAAHLNRQRAGQVVLPAPTLGDIRDTGMLVNDADNVLFVWRHQDEDTGEPLPNGIVRVGKARNGRPGGVPVVFQGRFMRFDSTLKEEQPNHEQEELKVA